MLLDDLKSETRSQHERLEQLNPLPGTRDDHVVQLATLYGFVSAWENALSEALPENDPVRAGRAKSAWLEEDLGYFGWNATQIAGLPRARELPSTASRPHILGAAYVFEGSTLGGQMISKHVERVLGLAEGKGYRYHRSYGPEVGARWQAFRGELLGASTPENDRVIVEAARQTFTLLHGWFNAQRAVAA